MTIKTLKDIRNNLVTIRSATTTIISLIEVEIFEREDAAVSPPSTPPPNWDTSFEASNPK